MTERDEERDECPCHTCSEQEFCDGLEARPSCCELCRYYNDEPDCENCDMMDMRGEMITEGVYRSERAELLIDLLVGALHEEGYKAVRMSDTEKFHTTAYDGIIVNDWQYGGCMFSISINQLEDEDYRKAFEREYEVIEFTEVGDTE